MNKFHSNKCCGIISGAPDTLSMPRPQSVRPSSLDPDRSSVFCPTRLELRSWASEKMPLDNAPIVEKETFDIKKNVNGNAISSQN